MSATTETLNAVADQLARIAESQIGTAEDAAHSNRGAAILKYQRATSLGGQGWPWCAAFVDWCVQQLLAEPEATTQLPKTFRAPRTAGAFALVDWARQVGAPVFERTAGKLGATPARGDVVVYAFSHCGIVTVPMSRVSGVFSAVEGNTNAEGGRDGFEVARRGRDLSLVRALIRLPLRATAPVVTGLLLCLPPLLSGCAPVYRSPLYPDTLSVTVRTTNRSEIQGMNFGLSWKLQPRAVVLADGRDLP